MGVRDPPGTPPSSTATAWRSTPGRCAPRASQNSLPEDFLDGRDAVLDLLEAAHAEGEHSLLEGLALDLDGGASGHDEFADAVRDLHDLVEAHAPLVARPVAHAAAAPLVELEGPHLVGREADVDERLGGNVLHLFLALSADAPDEALGLDEVHGRAHQERLDPHVDEAGHRR